MIIRRRWKSYCKYEPFSFHVSEKDIKDLVFLSSQASRLVLGIESIESTEDGGALNEAPFGEKLLTND